MNSSAQLFRISAENSQSRGEGRMMLCGLQPYYTALACGSVYQMAAYRQLLRGDTVSHNGGIDNSSYKTEEAGSLTEIIGTSRPSGWHHISEIEGWWEQTYNLVNYLDEKARVPVRLVDDLQSEIASHIKKELHAKLNFLTPRLGASMSGWQIHLIVLASLMVQILADDPVTQELSTHALRVIGGAELFLSGNNEEMTSATLAMQRVLAAIPLSEQMTNTIALANNFRTLLSPKDTSENRALLKAYPRLLSSLHKLPPQHRDPEITAARHMLERIAENGLSERIRSLADEALRKLNRISEGGLETILESVQRAIEESGTFCIFLPEHKDIRSQIVNFLRPPKGQREPTLAEIDQLEKAIDPYKGELAYGDDPHKGIGLNQAISKEHTDALADYIERLGARHVMEVGAGDGRLALALGRHLEKKGIEVRASDDGSWEIPADSHVEKMSAAQAAGNADVIIVSWAPKEKRSYEDEPFDYTLAKIIHDHLDKTLIVIGALVDTGSGPFFNYVLGDRAPWPESWDESFPTILSPLQLLKPDSLNFIRGADGDLYKLGRSRRKIGTKGEEGSYTFVLRSPQAPKLPEPAVLELKDYTPPEKYKRSRIEED